mgnify:CR=1 FL=1
MKKIKDEYKRVLDKCHEASSALSANKFNMEQHIQAMLIKDKFYRVNKVLYRTLSKLLFSFAIILIMVSPGIEIIKNLGIIKVILITILGTIPIYETKKEIDYYKKDKKEHSQVIRRFEDLTMTELKNKTIELAQKRLELEEELNKNRAILEQLKEKIEENDETEDVDDKKIAYHPSFTKDNCEKIKFKRRDEVCYKSQKEHMM